MGLPILRKGFLQIRVDELSFVHSKISTYPLNVATLRDALSRSLHSKGSLGYKENCRTQERDRIRPKRPGHYAGAAHCVHNPAAQTGANAADHEKNEYVFIPFRRKLNLGQKTGKET